MYPGPRQTSGQVTGEKGIYSTAKQISSRTTLDDAKTTSIRSSGVVPHISSPTRVLPLSCSWKRQSVLTITFI